MLYFKRVGILRYELYPNKSVRDALCIRLFLYHNFRACNFVQARVLCFKISLKRTFTSSSVIDMKNNCQDKVYIHDYQ